MKSKNQHQIVSKQKSKKRKQTVKKSKICKVSVSQIRKKKIVGGSDVRENDSQSEEDSESDHKSYSQEVSDDDCPKEGSKHKKSLLKLQDTDPEFYKYLKENDNELLNFQDTDSESDGNEDEDMFHKPPDELQVDSEESDVEEEGKLTSGSVTLAMIDSWRESLIDNPNVKNLSNIVEGFHAALERVTGEENSALKVDGSAVFNAVVELCVMHLQPAVTKLLKLKPANMKHPEKAKKWVKIKSILHSYFTDLLKLITGVASEHIISVLLKHLHTACPLLACFGKLSKVALKQLTKLWSSGEETVRVLAFLCILRLCTYQKSGLLNATLKLLYIAYIQNSKFVSVNTLPQINFMRRSLACLFSLDPTLSYQHAFLYIRQLAIHLRNAVTIHKKESFQSVYNWQYIQSLRLWVELLCSMKDNFELRQLLYPLVQIIIGCIKLIPTAQYTPLRFHCIKLLIKLGHEMDTHIPTLPFIMETLNWVDSGKNHKKLSMKPFDFTCVLRLSKSAMTENGFKDAIVENVYNLLLEASACCSHTVTYPDMLLPIITQLKTFLKDCQVGKYASKLKQLLMKLEENSKIINEERNRLSINVSDVVKIQAFESKMLAQKPPLLRFWEQWSKVSNLKAAKKSTNNEQLGELNLPKVKRKLVKRKNDEDSELTAAVLFPSDDESDLDIKIEKHEDDEVEKKQKETHPVKKRKVKKSKIQLQDHSKEEEEEQEEEDDIVEDLDANSFK